MAKKSKAPLIGLALTLLFFGIFIYWLISPSAEQTLIEKIQLSTTVEEVKMLYLNGKSEFTETNENGKIVPSVYLQDAVREKLTSMDLSQTEIKECLKWIPPKKMNLNLIVVPDLSNRLKTFPDQEKRDIEILNDIYETFKKRVSFNQDSRDLLMIEVTDNGQANQEFSRFANDLMIDLSVHQGKSNRLFFTSELQSRYKKAVSQVYREVIESYHNYPKTYSADYWSYFDFNCSGPNNKLKEDDFYNGYKNKLLLLSDGLLDGKRGSELIIYTQMDYSKRGQMVWPKFVNSTQDEILEIINQENLNIPKHHDVDLSNVEIMLCELRSQPKTLDSKTQLDVIEVYWRDWLERMKLTERDKFIPFKHQDSSAETIKKIREFIEN
jgi:hypothetical protein